MTRQLIRGVAALALVLMGMALAPAAAEPPPEQRPFVRVEGTRFMVGDEPFFFVGANLNVMHGPTARRYAAATIAAAAADGLRVGRLWALGEGLPDVANWNKQSFLFRAGPTGWQEPAFKQLDHVIAEAGKHGLRLVITLSNRWPDYGGLFMYLRWAGHFDVETYGYTDRFFTDPQCRRWFTEHLERVIGRVNSITGVRYRDDPTIMAWELQNEMTGTPEAAPARREWVAAMARKVRELDPNHLIVPGLIGYKLQVERESWIKMNQLPEVAYCDQHVYPEEHLRSRGLRNLRRYIDDRVQLAHHVVGKPIVFGEFGFADRGPPAARARWHRRFLERIFFNGGNGGMVWIYQPTLDWTRKFGILVDDARYRRLRGSLSAMALKARGTVRPRNPLLGPARGREPIAPTHAMMVRDRRPHRRWVRSKAGAWSLALPVERFHQAWFEEAGSWDGGVLVHAYGRQTGWIAYRFRGPPIAPRRLELRARLSSEYPGSGAPRHGYSRVKVLLDGQEIQELRVVPDDGVGRWYRVGITDPALLRKIKGGTHVLRFQVDAGPEANGVAIFGREARLNREPVEQPGPMRLEALP